MSSSPRTPYGVSIPLILACLGCGQPKLAPVGTADMVAVSAADIRDAGPEASSQPALDAPDGTLICPMGPGCPCTGNGECNSALCLETLDGKQCARTCIDTCPTGFSCAAVDSGAGDVISVCVPRFGHLCDPCTTSKDCKSVGLSGSACVDEGGLGRFCGVACVQAGDCPPDYTCKSVQATESQNVSQCVRNPDGDGMAFGSCPCSTAAKAEVLGTACLVATSYGGKAVTCAGTRTCGAAGLSACMLVQLGPEVCDGSDNDCNGQTDEGTCDDGQSCTQDACGGAKGCSHMPLDPTPCEDGDPCTDGDACLAGVCKPGKSICLCSTSVDCPDLDLCAGKHFCDKASHTCQVAPGTAVACPTPEPCHANVCDPKSGTCVGQLQADGSPCDDDDGCTIGESCQSGNCGGGANQCECKEQADCTGKEDGNLCNGTLYCDLTSHKCVINPASVVTCLAAPGPCLKPACDPKTGACDAVALPDGTTCDADGNACTTGDFCQLGACVSGTNTCTCKSTADCALQDDGDLCNGTLFCNLQFGKCQLNLATIVTCPTVDDTACRTNTCEPKTGTCALLPVTQVAKPCDDSNACTSGDVCQDGQCQGGTNICNCVNDAGCAKYDDGDLCNGTMYCDKTNGQCAVNPATIVVCPTVDDSACQKHICHPVSGACLAVDLTGTCDSDGSACTQTDTCLKGKCIADTNTCVCQQDTDCPDDGNMCNGAPYCDLVAHVCVTNSATTVSCPTVNDTACQHNTCQPATGACKVTSNSDGSPCTDGNACTAGDSCQAGTCAAGTQVCVCQNDPDCAKFEDGNLCNGTRYCAKSGASPACKVNPVTVVTCQLDLYDACFKHQCQPLTGLCLAIAATECDDGNPCTDDSCDLVSGCGSKPNTLPCSDGDACTLGDACKSGGCLPGAVWPCDDGNVCTADSCAANVGCVHLAASVACDDGNACISGEACTASACAGGAGIGCDDKNACTADSCDKLIGCQHAAVTGTCDDGDACTVGDACGGGKCLPGPVTACDDGNVCTADSCTANGGCVHLAVSVACDDGNACTSGEACAASACAGGAGIGCDDKNACTADSCDKLIGCQHAAAAGTCDDGDACTLADACGGGKCLPGTVTACDDGNVCTDDSCNKLEGCVHAENAATCTDGNACTLGDNCGGGGCVSGATTTCNDNNPCTQDSCDKASGCANIVTDGIGCDDGSSCTANDVCKGGTCVAGPAKLFNATFGGSGEDQAKSVAVMVDGGFVAAGYTSSKDLPGGQKSAGDVDMWLVHADAGGKLLWNQTFGGSNADSAACVVAMPDGGLAAIGITLSTDLPGGKKSAGGNDFWLVRTDSGGKLLWNQTFGGSKEDKAFGCVALADGGFALAGWTYSTDLPGGQKSVGDTDAWLLRTDAAGNLLWNQTYGAPGFDLARAVTVLTDGGFALVGNTDSTGGGDLWVVRTDVNGKLAWSRTYGGSGGEDGKSVVALADGGLAILAGTSSLDLPTGQASTGGYDFWLVRTDGAGNLLWNRTYGGSNLDDVAALTALADGGFAMAGHTYSTDLPGGQKTSAGGYADVWVVRTDAGGHMLWNRTYGGSLDDRAFALVAPVEGGLVLAGYSNSKNLPGGQTIAGVTDDYLLRTDDWGNASCADSGVCFSKTAASCDDVNTCTLDLCTGKLGCAHKNLADGSACDDGNLCTVAETCTTGACKNAVNVADGTACAGTKTCQAGACK